MKPDDDLYRKAASQAAKGLLVTLVLAALVALGFLVWFMNMGSSIWG